jgi:hypothetical protein
MSTAPSESIKTSLRRIMTLMITQPLQPLVPGTSGEQTQVQPWDLRDGLYAQTLLVEANRNLHGINQYDFVISLQVQCAVHHVYRMMRSLPQPASAAMRTAFRNDVAPFLTNLYDYLSEEEGRYRAAGKWDLDNDFDKEKLARFIIDFVESQGTTT